jgi:predicted MFS family arabinose efflux permease
VIARAPGLRPLLLAEVVSTTGACMTAVALPWLVLTTTGSAARAGLVAAVEWLPMALLGIPSGTLAARLGPRRTIIACDAARVPIVAAVPLLHWLGALDFGVLLALAFLAGVFFPAHFASQRTILPALLGEAADDLTRGNAVLQAANRLPMTLGPALGGLLVAVVGAPWVLVVDAASYGLSALLVTALVPRRANGAAAPPDEHGGLWDGARRLAGERVLRPLTCAYAGIDLAMQGVFLALPVLAFSAYDRNASLAGLLLAAWGAGALAGTVAALRLSAREPVGLIRWALVAQAAPLWLVAAPLPPFAMAAGMALCGLANPVANAPANTLVTLSVPAPLRAKTMLAFITASTTAAGAGLFIAGPVAEAFGPRAVIAGAAAVVSLSALWFALATRSPRRDIVAQAITSREIARGRT